MPPPLPRPSTPPPPPLTPAAVARPPVWRAVLLAAAIALAFADASIVVLGLPAIYGELHTTLVQTSWVITLYAVVVAVVAAALGPLARRLRPAPVAFAGLLIFAAGSVASGVAPDVAALFVGRTVQGLGAALVLVTSLPLLSALTGSTERGHRWWVTAAALGAAIGPALGGVLTEVFAWRAIFFVQVPAALAAILAVRAPGAGAVALDTPDHPDRRSFFANVGEVLVFAALVGALFLGVLLLVVVWGFEPIVGALVVSALPAASFAVRPLAGRLRPIVAGTAGAVSLAAGLAGLALLPRVSGWIAAAAFAFCGVGMGLVLSVLGPASLGRRSNPVGAASRSVAARHAGLVLGLLLIAPVLAGSLESKAGESADAGTARMLETQLPLRQKLPLAWALRNEIQRTQDGQVPDLDAVFQAQGAGHDAGVAAARDDLVGTIQGLLTRAFRGSFLVAALLALGSLLPLLVVAGGRAAAGRAATTPHAALLWPALVVGVVALAGAVFVVGEWRGGAQDFGVYRAADPCAASSSPYPGKGIDAAIQRIALGGLNGAACELGTTRERLVLSLDPKSGVGDVTWNKDVAAQAVKSGTSRAIDDAIDRGSLPRWAGSALRYVVQRAPLSWLLDKLPFG